MAANLPTAPELLFEQDIRPNSCSSSHYSSSRTYVQMAALRVITLRAGLTSKQLLFKSLLFEQDIRPKSCSSSHYSSSRTNVQKVLFESLLFEQDIRPNSCSSSHVRTGGKPSTWLPPVWLEEQLRILFKFDIVIKIFIIFNFSDILKITSVALRIIILML